MADTASNDPPPAAPPVRRASPSEVAPRYGIGRLSRHVLICAGPACCDAEAGARVWGVFKRRLARVNLDAPAPVFRTRCECLRMCDSGPIVVVYPEGTWYCNVTAAGAERIVSEHLIGGRIVDDLLFARDHLRGGALDGSEPA